MKLLVRPLIDRSFIGATPKVSSQFKASWSSTEEMLKQEIAHLQSPGMADPVIMVDCEESDIRLDGQLRANARPHSDAIAVAFESRSGPLMFQADRYNDLPHLYGSQMRHLWQHNVRAVALTLEALRAVDRYGATQTGQQYTGYRQITAKGDALTREQAILVLAEYGAPGVPPEHLNMEPQSLLHIYSRARRKTHPDRGGSAEAWHEVQAAATELGII